MNGARPAFAQTAFVQTGLDATGAIVSLGCLVHCLALPLASSLLLALMRPFEAQEWVHMALALVAVPVALVAMKKGFRIHGRGLPSVTVIPGLICLNGSLLIGDPHWLADGVAAFGAGLTVFGHLLNHRLTRLANTPT